MDIAPEIFEKSKILIKEKLTASSESLLQDMCAAAQKQLLSQIKDGVSSDGLRETLVLACAMLAAAMFIELDTDTIEEYSAGSIRLKKSPVVQRRDLASSMRTQVQLLLAGYLNDPGFCFKAVRS